jgi:hypothetical protein
LPEDFAGLHDRLNRKFARQKLRAIVGDPVDDLVPGDAELVDPGFGEGPALDAQVQAAGRWARSLSSGGCMSNSAR